MAAPAVGAETKPFVTSPKYRSQDGQLFVTKEARPGPVTVGRHTIAGGTHNGAYARRCCV